MNCPNCGTTNHQNAHFCASCGTSFDAMTETGGTNLLGVVVNVVVWLFNFMIMMAFATLRAVVLLFQALLAGI